MWLVSTMILQSTLRRFLGTGFGHEENGCYLAMSRLVIFHFVTTMSPVVLLDNTFVYILPITILLVLLNYAAYLNYEW